MADVFIYSGDGTEPHEEAQLARDVPVADLAGSLGLKPEHYVTPADQPPFINRQTGDWAEEKDRYVLVRIGADEAALSSWQPGYYLVSISATEARRALGVALPLG